MENHSWWKTGIVVVVVLLGLAVAGVIVSGGGSDVSATEPSSAIPQGDNSTAIFAKYIRVDGEAIDSKHKGWIDILSVDWGSRRFVSRTSRRTGSPTIDSLTLAFAYDKAAPAISEKLLSGQMIPKVDVELTANYGGARATYLKFELTNVMVTSYQISGAGGVGPPMVVVGNNFEEIKVTYTEFDAAGKSKGTTTYEYDSLGGTIAR